MEWMNVDWIVANWVPLAVFALLGFLLAWLVVALPASRHALALEKSGNELDRKLSKSEADMATVRRDLDTARRAQSSAETERDAAAAKVAVLESTVKVLEDDKSQLQMSLSEKETALEEALAAPPAPEPSVEENQEALRTGEVEIFDAEAPETPDMGPAAIAAVFGSVAQQVEPSNVTTGKDIALSEAYARVTTLEQGIVERDAALQQVESELQSVRNDLLAAHATRQELETRLIRAREDVASELAVLASTMIKMKDDQVARSEARVQSLQAALESSRAETAQVQALAMKAQAQTPAQPEVEPPAQAIAVESAPVETMATEPAADDFVPIDPAADGPVGGEVAEVESAPTE